MKLDPAAVHCLPEKLCRELKAVAFGRRDRELLVALADAEGLAELRLVASGFSLTPVVVPLQLVERMLSQCHWPAPGPEVELGKIEFPAGLRSRLPGWVELESPTRQATPSEAHWDEGPIVRAVNLILSQAINDGAREIQILPGPKCSYVCYRVDGVLHEVMNPPRNIHRPLLGRLRRIAEMAAQAQRGWMRVTHDGRDHDFHLKFLSSHHGELCVAERAHCSTLAELELPDGFRGAIEQSAGLAVVEAPEGHGLRLTFGAVLHHLRDRLPVGVCSWSCARTDIPVVWAPSAQDVLIAGLLAYKPRAAVFEEVTDGSSGLARLAETCLVVAGVRQEEGLAGPRLGTLRQRLLRRFCPFCREQQGEFWRARGCDRCYMSGFKDWRLVGHWSEEPGGLAQRVWALARAGDTSPAEAEEAVGPC